MALHHRLLVWDIQNGYAPLPLASIARYLSAGAKIKLFASGILALVAVPALCEGIPVLFGLLHSNLEKISLLVAVKIGRFASGTPASIVVLTLSRDILAGYGPLPSVLMTKSSP